MKYSRREAGLLFTRIFPQSATKHFRHLAMMPDDDINAMHLHFTCVA